jgi:hypothetical protein
MVPEGLKYTVYLIGVEGAGVIFQRGHSIN